MTKHITETHPPAQYDTTYQSCGLDMKVTCIKCQKHGSLTLNHYKTNGHRYQYYGIQHYNRDTKKRKWCYLGKYESLPDQYKTVIHNNQSVSTTDPQTAKTGKTQVFSDKSSAGSGIPAQIYQ